MDEKCTRMRHLRSDDGAAAVIVGISIVLLAAVVALVVDVGSLYAERRSLQTAADAAALAGVQKLPGNPGGASTLARDYVAANSTRPDVVEVTVSSGNVANDTIEVRVKDTRAPLFFARVFGRSRAEVGVRAAARITSVTAYGHGVMPFGIMANGNESPLGGYGFGWGQEITVKLAGGQAAAGNFMMVSLSDPPGQNWGGNDLKQTLEQGGTSNPVYIDTNYATAPGNKSILTSSLNHWIGGDRHTFSEVISAPDENGVVHVNLAPGDTERCHRLIVCPIIVNPEYAAGDPLRYTYDDVSGRKEIRVIGFAEFFVTNVGTHGNEAYVTGRMVRTIAPQALWTGPPSASGQLHYSLIE